MALSALAPLALMTGLMTPAPVTAANSTIGRTWPIAEPDALSEIEGRAAHVPDMKTAFGPRERWSAMQPAALGIARAAMERAKAFVKERRQFGRAIWDFCGLGALAGVLEVLPPRAAAAMSVRLIRVLTCGR